MNNINFSEEVIEIDGKEYTLWINRVGIVNWEKATKLSETAKEMENKLKNGELDVVEINDETDPFAIEGSLTNEEKKIYDIYSKFYWMALYKNHKLTVKEADELFHKAIDEYGIEQMAELAQQMLNNANLQSDNLKNLKALKSTK